MLRGAEVVGQATLTRFYILHTALLPVILIALIGFHLIQVGRHGIAPSITKRGQALAGRFVPVFPNYLGTVMMLGLGLIVVLIVFSVRQRAPLDFPADPTSADYIPRPEWYFLSLYELLKYFPGAWKSAIVLIPVIVLGSLVILPFVDKSAERRPWRKPVATTIALVYLTGIVGLTLLALRD